MAEIDNEVLRPTGLTPSTPVVEETAPAAPPAETPEAKPAEQPAAAEDAREDATAQAPAAPGEDVSRETDAEGQPVPAKKPSRGVQKALDRLTERAVVAEQRATTAEQVVAQILAAQVQQQARPQAPPPQAQPPKREDFSDWEQFNRATAQWEARQASQQVVRQELGNFLAAVARSNVQQASQAEAQQRVAKLNAALEKAPERFSDWEEVQASDAPIPPSLANAITLSEDPVLVMHHLANPEEHAKFMRMTPEQQIYHVGRIVASAQPSTVSKAPAPARPVSGNRAQVGAGQYRDDMTPEQHKAFMAKAGANRGLR